MLALRLLALLALFLALLSLALNPGVQRDRWWVRKGGRSGIHYPAPDTIRSPVRRLQHQLLELAHERPLALVLACIFLGCCLGAWAGLHLALYLAR